MNLNSVFQNSSNWSVVLPPGRQPSHLDTTAHDGDGKVKHSMVCGLKSYEVSKFEGFLYHYSVHVIVAFDSVKHLLAFKFRLYIMVK